MHRALVVIAVALSLAACRSSRTEEKLELDPMFTLPFAKSIEVPPIDHPLPAEGARDAELAFTLTFRFLHGEEVLHAPDLTVLPAQRSSVQIINQTAYVADFDIEVAQDAFIAEPVIGLIDEGLELDCAVVPTKDGRRIVLAWKLETSELKMPIRTRNIVIGSRTSPVTVQLPVVSGRTAVGRTLLDPGVETLLTRTEGRDGTLSVFVSAVPVRRPAIAPIGTEIFLDDVTESVKSVPEPEPLIDHVKEMDPPEGRVRLTVSLATTTGPRMDTPLHLDAKAAQSILDGFTILSSQTIAAAPEDGARIAWTTNFRCHSDYDVEVGSEFGILEPIINTIELGFQGRFRMRDGEPVLSFSHATLASNGTFSTRVGTTGVTIEMPELHMRRGRLRIRGDVSILPVGPLTDGRSVVLVVRRAESR